MSIQKTESHEIRGLRPLSLLNTDYRLLARIIANRIRPWMPDILRPSKHCAREGSTILAVAAMREAVTYAEISHTPLCILSIDFRVL